MSDDMNTDVLIADPAIDDVIEQHPTMDWLREERMPHIWCPGCGIGTSVNSFTRAVEDTGLKREDIAIVSGIGCTGRVAGYLRLDSFHTTHGRAIPFATGLKLAHPKTTVVVYSGDGDLFAIGGNHFIHAARRNVDMTVICVNNFNYGMTGGQLAPTTPEFSAVSTAPFGSTELPFNLPYLAQSCGAVYVARWTVFHVRQLQKAIKEAMLKTGFTFIEVLSPCPTLYVRRNKLGGSLAVLQDYKERSVIKNGLDAREADLLPDKPIICGKFVDTDRQNYIRTAVDQLKLKLGDRFRVPEAWQEVLS
ncbi:MAG: 2-oxoacid:ferredoxin oxidoreductase subunit beta [Candidatus Zixiibacteriota bacterium]